MFSSKVVATLLLIAVHQIECSVLTHAPAVLAPAVPAIRYRIVAPQNIRPFAAQVSTFTRGLNVFASPYAAGVLSGPALVSRGLVPAPSPIGPAVFPAAAPAPAAVYPAVGPAPLYHAASPVAVPAPVPVGHSHLLPAPFGRSIHAVAPGVAPAYPGLGHGAPVAHYLG